MGKGRHAKVHVFLGYSRSFANLSPLIRTFHGTAVISFHKQIHSVSIRPEIDNISLMSILINLDKTAISQTPS